ncbi:MAG: hypothetical protein JWN62_2783 [Acidimicrobiales bacterium]|nr:hypothetical protein [Acidimicrobiales bacterium]
MEQARGVRTELHLPVVPGYTLVNQIGSGGSSIVYRAVQDNLGREVAIKVLRHEVDDARAWHRFEREARMIASLSGQLHVVTIYDVGRTIEGRPYLVTELLDRGSLSDVLERRGPLGAPAAVAVGVAIAAALTAAHARKILHRDLKPGNVLLGSRGQIKLADFGIARLMAGHATTTTAQVAFTPEHAAPEVLHGEQEGPQSDVYGLASTVLTALTGRSPFARRPDERIEAMMWRKLSGPPPDIPSTVPPALANLLTRCLAVAPADRPDLPTVAAELGTMPADTRWLLPATGAADAASSFAPPSVQAHTDVSPAPAAAPAVAVAGIDHLEWRRSRRTRGWWFVGAVLLLLLAASAVALAVRAHHGQDSVSMQPGVATPLSTAAPVTAAPTTPIVTDAAAASVLASAPVSLVPAPTTSATPAVVPVATAADSPTIGEAEAVEFVRTYYAEVAAGEFDTTWSKLDPGFRSDRNLTFERYRSYWRSTSIAVDQLTFIAGPGQDQAKVRFSAVYTTGGSTAEEVDEVTITRTPDGTLVFSEQRRVS